MAGLLSVLRSRKFWASVVGLLVALGFIQVSDLQEPELVSAILTVVTTITYALSVAIEDAGRGAGGQLK